jgi:hypothetical protein
MSAEHLPIANYDSQSVAEIVEKLSILAERGSVDVAAIRAYEQEAHDGGRTEVLKKLDEIDGQEAGTPETEPQAELPQELQPEHTDVPQPDSSEETSPDEPSDSTTTPQRSSSQ